MGEDSTVGIAIIGIACRFPGSADHTRFWQNLCEGAESITPLSDEGLLSAGVPADRLSDPSYVKAASLLPDIDKFDAAFFEYSPQEARLMDPQHRLLLEVAWEAFEDAGKPVGTTPKPVGVYTGLGGVVSSYLVDRLPFTADLPDYTGSLAHLGNDKDFASTRVSYKLNLTGPSISVQTACSTSLVAVHLACQAILAGECEMALAGAATVRVPQHIGYTSVKGGILSPDGHCRAFDADAHGTIFGSGVAAVLLKDIAAAVSDGDNIYAVIRGSAVNNDGADKTSYTASSVVGQARAMVEAMQAADVRADDISFVECHGTGTELGDPLEIDALTRAFRTGTERTGYCAIGSVKTNIGHLEQTAGLAALIKVALALRNEKIPPSLNFQRPNPKIDFAACPFFVNTECRDWPAGDRPRFAAINSLGLGGTNAFMVLEEPPPAEKAGERSGPCLFTLSARTPAALLALKERHRAWLSHNKAPLQDICHTITAGRTHFPVRFAAVAGSKDQLRQAIGENTGTAISQTDGERRLAFVFSGQASQYPRMGAQLYRDQPVFQEEVDRCSEIAGDRLGLSLADILLGDHELGLIDDTAYTQPALLAVQAGLVALWRSWGINPDVVLGHSVGEFAAAYCAGVYTLEQALHLVLERAHLMQRLPRNGAMIVVFSDEQSVASALSQIDSTDISIAALNGPGNTVVSGARDGLSALIRYFESLSIRCQLLNVSHAFHSPLMRSAVQEFMPIAASVQGRRPTINWISTVSGAPMLDPPGAEYWCDHALKPVRYADGMNKLDQIGVSNVIEVGPGNTLLALGRSILKQKDRVLLGSLNKRSELKEILTSLAELYRRGFDIDWEGFNRPFSGRVVSMPTYPFERKRFWLEDDGIPRSRRAHPNGLTGTRLRSALPDTQFESVYSLQRFCYLNDHRIYGMPVLPTTAGLTALREAAHQHFGSGAAEVGNLQYREAMVLPESGEIIVQSILTPLDDSTVELRLTSADTKGGNTWRTHMVGVARRSGPARDETDANGQFLLNEIRNRCSDEIPVHGYYQAIRALGLEYGTSFRAIETLRRGTDEVLTHVRLPAHLNVNGQSGLHPALLDACLHLYPALANVYGDFTRPAAEAQHTYLPVSVERFHCTDESARAVWAHGVRRQMGNGAADRYTVDIAIYHDDGRFAAAIEGLSVKLLSPEALEASIGTNDTDGQSTVTRVTVPDTPIDDRAPTNRLQLNTASGEKRRALLVGLVREEAMKVLGVTDTIDPARPLRELGLDSLMSVTLASRLESALGIGVSPVALIQGPCVGQIVDALLSELPGTDAAPATNVTSPNPEHDTIVTSVSDEEAWLQPVTVQPGDFGPVWPVVEPPLESVLSRTDDSSGNWINVVGPRPSPRLRLFCFPFAGGGSAVYQNWAQSIDPTIEVVAIEPPGRLGRITETPVADMEEFVDQLVSEMRGMLDLPFAFYGHCLGALTMYETSRWFGQTRMPRPEHLFVSGARPPDRINDQGRFEERLMRDLLQLAEYRINLPPYAQPDDVFAEIIRHFNIRATDELLNDPELRQLMLPVIRTEFQMASNYRFAGGPPLNIPITCFAAKGDPYVSRGQVLGWGRFTNARLLVHIREGAHFAVVEDAAFIQDVINRELETVSGSAQDLGAVSPW